MPPLEVAFVAKNKAEAPLGHFRSKGVVSYMAEC